MLQPEAILFTQKVHKKHLASPEGEGCCSAVPDLL